MLPLPQLVGDSLKKFTSCTGLPTRVRAEKFHFSWNFRAEIGKARWNHAERDSYLSNIL